MSGTHYDNWKTEDGYEEWSDRLWERAAEHYMDAHYEEVIELIQKHVNLNNICQEMSEEDYYAE